MNLVPLILPDGAWFPYIELANTDELRRRGLAGRRRLNPGQGMLFSFGLPGMYAMTMRGCLIPLDMIWMDGDGIVQFVGTGRLSTDGGSAYGAFVLELAAGQADAHGVIPGSQIRFVTPSGL